jgi:hypothetical protein
MNLDDFKVADFPLMRPEAAGARGGFVYVLCFAGNGRSETPF